MATDSHKLRPECKSSSLTDKRDKSLFDAIITCSNHEETHPRVPEGCKALTQQHIVVFVRLQLSIEKRKPNDLTVLTELLSDVHSPYTHFAKAGTRDRGKIRTVKPHVISGVFSATAQLFDVSLQELLTRFRAYCKAQNIVIPHLIGANEENQERRGIERRTVEERLDKPTEPDTKGALPPSQAPSQQSSTQNAVDSNVVSDKAETTNKKSLYGLLAIALLVGFSLVLSQGYFNQQTLGAKLDSIVAQSESPELVRRSVNELLFDHGIPEKAVVSYLELLPEIGIAPEDIPRAFDAFAAAYAKSKETNTASNTDQQQQVVGGTTQRFIDNGEFEQALSLNALELQRLLQVRRSLERQNANIEAIHDHNTEELVGLARALVEQYQRVAQIQSLSGQYLDAAESLVSASDLLAAQPHAEAGLLADAGFAFYYDGALHSRASSLKRANELFGMALSALSTSDRDDVLRRIRVGYIFSLTELAEMTGVDDLRVKAENLAEESHSICEEMAVNRSCFELFLLQSSILIDRGLRSTFTAAGAQAHEARLNKAIASASFAKDHAEGLGSFEKAIAFVYYALAQIELANFHQDTDSVQKYLAQIFAVFDGMRDQQLLGAYELVLSKSAGLGRYAGSEETVAVPSVVRLVRLLRFKAESIRETEPYNWGITQVNMGRWLTHLWRRTNDNARLREAIVESEKAFSIFDEDRPFELYGHQIGFGVLLSDYGRAADDPEYLSRAIHTFKAAADNTGYSGSLHDRRVALDNLRVSLYRLQQTGSNECWENLRFVIDKEVTMIGEHLELTTSILDSDVMQGADHDSYRAQHLQGVVGLKQAKNVSDKAFIECFGPTPETPSTQLLPAREYPIALTTD